MNESQNVNNSWWRGIIAAAFFVAVVFFHDGREDIFTAESISFFPIFATSDGDFFLPKF